MVHALTEKAFHHRAHTCCAQSSPAQVTRIKEEMIQGFCQYPTELAIGLKYCGLMWDPCHYSTIRTQYSWGKKMPWQWSKWVSYRTRRGSFTKNTVKNFTRMKTQNIKCTMRTSVWYLYTFRSGIMCCFTVREVGSRTHFQVKGPAKNSKIRSNGFQSGRAKENTGRPDKYSKRFGLLNASSQYRSVKSFGCK